MSDGRLKFSDQTLELEHGSNDHNVVQAPAGILPLPPVDGVLGDGVAARQLRHRGDDLLLRQDRYNLLFAIALALNLGAPFFGITGNSTSRMA